jgi:hypothetical protein
VTTSKQNIDEKQPPGPRDAYEIGATDETIERGIEALRKLANSP